MRARGQTPIALLALVVVAAVGAGLDRLGPRTDRPAAAGGSAPSGAWLCPHGGSASGWQTTLSVANPGSDPVDVRVTSLGAKRSGQPMTFTVPADSTLPIPADTTGREASTLVEYFGGWVAVGWVAVAGGAESGVAAEPCADSASASSRTWFAADGNTDQGQETYLIVMNPFDVETVFDVVLLTATRAPIRNSDLTGYVLDAHSSVALRLNKWADGEVAVGAEVDVSFGRVAVSTLGASDGGGIRSVMGVTSASKSTLLPATGDSGQSTLVVVSPSEGQARFGATLLSSGAQEAAGGLTEAVQGGTSAKTYPVISAGPSAIQIVANADSPALVAVRRAQGTATDVGATGGATSAASAWIVTPTVFGAPAVPGLVLSNPGSEAVDVTLRILPIEGGEPAAVTTTVTVPAASAADVPSEFLSQTPGAAVLATSQQGTFLAAGASSSFGTPGFAYYAVAIGIPVPGSP